MEMSTSQQKRNPGVRRRWRKKHRLHSFDGFIFSSPGKEELELQNSI
jgi:uncharacterized protein YggL (DUF469 family)